MAGQYIRQALGDAKAAARGKKEGGKSGLYRGILGLDPQPWRKAAVLTLGMLGRQQLRKHKRGGHMTGLSLLGVRR